jgi:hypothetical protein
VLACAVVAAALAWPLRKIGFHVDKNRFRTMLHWEFWPPAVFYIPVALKYLLLGIRYRSISLPTLGNPGMRTGGMIGESKYETIAELANAHPAFVTETYLAPFESIEQQVNVIGELRRERNLEYPLVLKPDVGQRGFGFKLIHSDAEARSYVEIFRRDTLLQRYAAGPYEAGILYWRLPDAARGRVFAITDKVFPEIVGDGLHSFEELIRQDPRASNLAGIYLARFASERGRVLADGERLRLVEAGNHCQGAIFLDGSQLFSEELENRIDEISRSVPGFFFGRYDVRYRDGDSLRRGQEFQIIELNGATSEATNIYDPRNTLWSAYRTLFRQWEILFAIADQNRKRGFRPTSVRVILKNWLNYRQESALHPVSD